MNETEIRVRLFELAADAPQGLTAPPQLLRRARRRTTLTLVSSAVIAVALVAGGIAGVRWLGKSDSQPAVRPSPDLPELRRDGEIITMRGSDLIGVDPHTGNGRTLVDGREIHGTVGNAAFSPDGGWLAFDVATQSSLWVMDAELGPRRLAVNPGRWAWSPTDAQLAMMHDSTLTLIDPSTGRRIDLGPTFDDGDTTGPVWSPDGTRIVFGVRGGSLYSVDVGSGDRSLLVPLSGNLDSIDGIEWSPDGAHVAILADLIEGLRRLYVMNADGSGLRVLVNDFEPGDWPGWFPDDPSQQTAWSPDGTRLTYRAFSGPNERELRIWTVSLDGSAPSLVASHTNGECCIDGGPVWSPDGSQIAFETDSSHIVINADGTDDAREIDELTYLSWLGGWYFCFCYG
jgi:Tol biopolymer transport system component